MGDIRFILAQNEHEIIRQNETKNQTIKMMKVVKSIKRKLNLASLGLSSNCWLYCIINAI
jgi:hypothetical protein